MFHDELIKLQSHTWKLFPKQSWSIIIHFSWLETTNQFHDWILSTCYVMILFKHNGPKLSFNFGGMSYSFLPLSFVLKFVWFSMWKCDIYGVMKSCSPLQWKLNISKSWLLRISFGRFSRDEGIAFIPIIQ